MKKLLLTLFLVLLATALTSPASAVQVRRLALVVGANRGGYDRPELKFAVSDAQHFAAVLRDIGGVAAGDCVVLDQPSLHDLERAFDRLQRQTQDTRRGQNGPDRSRIELVFYYSGHADEKGLLLGEDRYSYRTLRERLDSVPAEVRIAVLDACASGAFTRLKGGKQREPFLTDASADMQGHAFLTSNTADEVAQESERISGSYFTYYLVSGLRGAADVSGEGKVTLNEAYGFAFSETLGDTLSSRGGAQHPAYDINLSGTGDVVMTDLRETSASLVLAESLDGRFFIKDLHGTLVVELYKPHGRRVEIALPPGAYKVYCRQEPATMVTSAQLVEGKSVLLEPEQFVATTPDPSLTRGRLTRRLSVAGRHSLSFSPGYWSTPSRGPSSAVVRAGWENNSFSSGMLFTHYLDENLAVTAGFNVLEMGESTVVTREGTFSGSSTLYAIPIGARWFPERMISRSGTTRPFLAAALGPIIGEAVGSDVIGGKVEAGGHTETAALAYLGGGVDFHVSRSFALGLGAGYNLMTDFARSVAGHDNYSGFELRVAFGWVFGKGRNAGR
jgi:hypothetical protein